MSDYWSQFEGKSVPLKDLLQWLSDEHEHVTDDEGELLEGWDFPVVNSMALHRWAVAEAVEDKEIAKAFKPVPVTYDDIKAGDIIKIDYDYGFSVGVALHEEALYDYPERPERMWMFDGMDYLGCSTGNWMMGGGMTRISELEHSEWDEKARGWKRKAQADAEKLDGEYTPCTTKCGQTEPCYGCDPSDYKDA